MKNSTMYRAFRDYADTYFPWRHTEQEAMIDAEAYATRTGQQVAVIRTVKWFTPPQEPKGYWKDTLS